jgi:hypothetical protein
LSPESRLLLVSYLSSVWLLLCLACLAKTMGGGRFALLTICLACGHREFLALSESLPPAALPLAFAILSSRELLAHQTSDGSPLVSWSLMTSSLALAASWLAGGESALASWCVLFAVSLLSVFSKHDSLTRGTWGRAIRQRFSTLMIAIAGLLLVTLMAAAIVVGWQSAFSQKLSLPSLVGNSSWSRRPWPIEFQSVAASMQTLMQTAGTWLGFVMLSVLQLARVRQPQTDRASTPGIGFLVGWSAVAWITQSAIGAVPGGESAHSSVWAGFQLLPLLFLAAWGLDAVLRREVGVESALTVTLVTLGAVFAPRWADRLPNSITGSWFAAGVLMGAIVIGTGVLVVRKIAKSESHCRMALLSCVVLVVVTDFTSGFFSRPRLMDDDRELQAFRRQLITETPPNECWLMTEETSPARLRFFLRSLWRGVALREAKDWETVLLNSPRKSAAKPVEPEKTRSKRTPAEITKTRAIVVTWGTPKLPADDLKRRGQALTQVTAPHYFQGRLLKGYRWIERAEGPNSR